MGDAFNTPELDEFMVLYNTVVCETASASVRLFSKITSKMSGKIPFAYVLCELFTNSPNSCTPESLFSIFNTTYNGDHHKSHADYIELSIQS